jgi:hypothetical protein
MGFFDFLKKKEFAEIAELKKLLEKYQPVIDNDIEIAKQKSTFDTYKSNAEKELEATIAKRSQEIDDVNLKLAKLNNDYIQSLEIYTKLKKEISIYESKLDLIEFGIYEPVYNFEKSDDYRAELQKVLDKQKQMIQDDEAAKCSTSWTVEGSAAKGKVVVNKFKKLMLRAFNGECDSIIAKVKWNNFNQMKERIQKLRESLNKLGEGFHVSISFQYANLKEQELILEYEYQVKKQKEKEELRRIQEELREEEKARREIEQAQREAEKDEANYQKALEKARKEIEQSTGEKHDRLLAQIQKLEQDLKEAQEKKERAISMAQQTKRGHVYIISNIGSFGEEVFKIGMTRRLEPEDRIRELGDASVPFQFDTHALIYSEDAPSLENELHRVFEKKSVNLVNLRKEFFKVTIDEIEEAVKKNTPDAEFIRLPEAMEYRETLAILERMKNKASEETIEQKIRSEFPESLIHTN